MLTFRELGSPDGYERDVIDARRLLEMGILTSIIGGASIFEGPFSWELVRASQRRLYL